MEKITTLTALLFIFSTGFTVWCFWKACQFSRITLVVIATWIAVTGALSLSGFYLAFNVIPPRLVFAVGPPLILIVILFTTQAGKNFLNNLSLEHLTLLHVVRIPVEIGLHALFVRTLIPQLMTYEGYNFDILSGITAPFVYYLVFVKKRMNRRILLIWNFLCLALLINIVTMAILSTPTNFQQLAFDQPNIGVLYFPVIWLPAIIVPLVLLSHLTAIKQLYYAFKKAN